MNVPVTDASAFSCACASFSRPRSSGFTGGLPMGGTTAASADFRPSAKDMSTVQRGLGRGAPESARELPRGVPLDRSVSSSSFFSSLSLSSFSPFSCFFSSLSSDLLLPSSWADASFAAPASTGGASAEEDCFLSPLLPPFKLSVEAVTGKSGDSIFSAFTVGASPVTWLARREAADTGAWAAWAAGVPSLPSPLRVGRPFDAALAARCSGVLPPPTFPPGLTVACLRRCAVYFKSAVCENPSTGSASLSLSS
mmetsp:Transcript_48724/g.122584  ORF Transcript_48724/g.122584 Transcript_48724/m.122584 type:complete len:253 (+) Transcript_48724:1635-2393(+)